MKNFIEKLKFHQDSIFLAAVIIMVGLIGLGLGRLSAKYQAAELKIQSTLVNTTDLNKIVTSKDEVNVTLENSATPLETQKREVAANQKVVGNKSSKIYHYEDCPGALRMSENNKIFFASVLEAKTAGFRPAANCLGLE